MGLVIYVEGTFNFSVHKLALRCLGGVKFASELLSEIQGLCGNSLDIYVYRYIHMNT